MIPPPQPLRLLGPQKCHNTRLSFSSCPSNELPNPTFLFISSSLQTSQPYAHQDAWWAPGCSPCPFVSAGLHHGLPPPPVAAWHLSHSCLPPQPPSLCLAPALPLTVAQLLSVLRTATAPLRSSSAPGPAHTRPMTRVALPGLSACHSLPSFCSFQLSLQVPTQNPVQDNLPSCGTCLPS